MDVELPGREVRSYPALLSTEAEALAWARAGAPAGAVVVAGYQASPRGRAGLPWEVRPELDAAFSLVLRPALPVAREGWVYVVASAGVADAAGEGAAVGWPDEVRRGGERAAAVGVQTGLGPEGVEWAVVSVLLVGWRAIRAAVEAIEAAAARPSVDVLRDYLPRCETIGRRVRARLIPLGPAGPQVTGTAVGCLPDGSLRIETEEGRVVAVPPQNLALLEPAD